MESICLTHGLLRSPFLECHKMHHHGYEGHYLTQPLPNFYCLPINDTEMYRNCCIVFFDGENNFLRISFITQSSTNNPMNNLNTLNKFNFYVPVKAQSNVNTCSNTDGSTKTCIKSKLYIKIVN